MSEQPRVKLTYDDFLSREAGGALTTQLLPGLRIPLDAVFA